MLEKTEETSTPPAVQKYLKENKIFPPLSNKSVIIISLTVLSVTKNPFSWLLQAFWRACGDFWQGLWDRYLDAVGEDPVTLWVWGVCGVIIVIYASLGTLYTVFLITNKPEWVRKYKSQPGTNEPVDLKKVPDVILWVTINITVLNFVIYYYAYLLMEWRGYPAFRTLPTFQRILYDFVIYATVEEIGYYYSHRLLHHRWLYKHFHKKHHEWTAPLAITTLYAHPVEHFISNTPPFLLGPFIAGSHVFSAYLWYLVAFTSSLHSHSGYTFPFFPLAEFHDYHHMKFNKNFGALGVLDYLHGTHSELGLVHSYINIFLKPKEKGGAHSTKDKPEAQEIS